MWHSIVGVLLTFIFTQIPVAFGDDSRKEFPDSKCAVSLPGPNWVWIDPKTVSAPKEKIIAFLASKDNVRLTVSCQPMEPGETVKDNSLPSFEAGLLESGKLTKVSSRKMTFQAVPAMEIVTNSQAAGGSGSYLIVFFANRMFYKLLIATLGKLADTNYERDAIFNSFQFLGTPAIPPTETVDPEIQKAFERGKRAAPIFDLLCGGMILGGIALVIVFAVRMSKRTGQRNRRYRDADDDDDRPRRRRLRDDDDDDDDNDDDDDGRSRRGSRRSR
jgi:hypothetical protein